MTISSTTNRVSYTGNGVTTAFSFPYKFLANADLVVVETIIATGVQVVKAITTHYTVTGAGDPNGGTVTAVAAPASTVTWTIYRDPAITQAVDLVDNDPFDPDDAVETPLDKLTMVAQRLKDRLDRAVRLPEGDTSGVTMVLPAELDRASKVLGFDADGELDVYDSASAVTEAANVTFTQDGADAVSETLQSRGRHAVFVTDFMTTAQRVDVAARTALVDVGAAIQAANNYAETLLPASATMPDGSAGYAYGGVTIFFTAGRYKSATAVAKPPNVAWEGGGSGGTVLEFSYDGPCVTVKNNTDGAYPYNHKRAGFRHMQFKGDRTKTSQVILDFERFSFSEMLDIDVGSSGSIGIRLTECSGGVYTKVRSNGNVGAGWHLVANAGPLPCNANTFTECQGIANDGEGLILDGAFGNRWYGGVFEENFASTVFSSIGTSEVAAARQVRITGIARGNTFYGTWFEGVCNAHVYVDTDGSSTSQFNSLVNCTLIPKGTAGNVDRAIVVNKGHLRVIDPNWQGTEFRTITSSTAPIRIGKANGGRVYLSSVLGFGPSADAGLMVEDKDGNDGNLEGLAVQDLMTGGIRRMYGRNEIYSERGNVALDFYRTSAIGGVDWEENPWLQPQDFRTGLAFGSGSAAVDVILRRIAAAQISVQELTGLSGLNFKVATTLLSAVSGASVTATSLIPDGAFVIGVATRVTTAIGNGGGTTGYQVGDGSDADRWGSIAAITAGTTSSNADATANFTGAFTSANNVVITAVGGNFDGTGAIRVTVAYLDVTVPAQ